MNEWYVYAFELLFISYNQEFCLAVIHKKKKIADDLYVVGNSGEELLNNWVKVLEALDRCDLTLSRSKTIINPRSTTILG